MKTKTRLPKGAKLVNPFTKKIGSWVEMTFDAEVIRYGIKWYRVKDGMGVSGEREDWVADLPAGCLSIHDYHWNGNPFGRDWGTFNGAIMGETKLFLQDQQARLLEFRQKITKVEATLRQLKQSLRSAK